MHEATQILKALWTERDSSRATTLNPPLYRGSTVVFDSYAQFCQAGRHQYSGITYGTDRLPTQRQFEEALRQMEGGAVTRVFPSGIAAIQTALLALIKNGDHLLLVDNAYGPAQRFCRRILTRFGVTVEIIPPDTGADIIDYLRPETTLILLESPGSISFELQDIRAITAIAHERGIATLLDATWATPLYVKPLELGVDLSIHSVTKYIAGYSDVLAGAVTANSSYGKIFADFYQDLEIYTPAEECYLALRGLQSMATRLRQHEQSALVVARWLQTQQIVDEVLHPALPEHPQHHLWQRDFCGSSGLFAFTFKEEYNEAQMAACIDTLDLFRLGYSWGGAKSLITTSRLNRSSRYRYAGKTVVRLHIGLEENQDLIDDLARGFAMLR